MENNLAMGIGFRHVVEDAIAILNNDEIEATRRKYVLDDLSELLQKAMKGLDLDSQESFFVGSENRNAFDTFQFFNQYLGTTDQDGWRKQLPVAMRAFEQLKEGEALESGEKEATVLLFSSLLHESRTQNNLGVPQEPQDIRIR